MKKALAIIIALVLVTAMIVPLAATAAPPAVPPPDTKPVELTEEYTYSGTWPLAAGSYYPELDNAGIPAGAEVYSAYLMAEDYSATPLPVPASLTGYTKVDSLAALTDGTWAIVNVGGAYPYIFTLGAPGAGGGSTAPAGGGVTIALPEDPSMTITLTDAGEDYAIFTDYGMSYIVALSDASTVTFSTAVDVGSMGATVASASAGQTLTIADLAGNYVYAPNQASYIMFVSTADFATYVPAGKVADLAVGGGGAVTPPTVSPAPPADTAPPATGGGIDYTQPANPVGEFYDTYDIVFGRDREMPNRYIRVSNLYDHYIYELNAVAWAHQYTIYLKAVPGNTIRFSELTVVTFKSLTGTDVSIPFQHTTDYVIDKPLLEVPEFVKYSDQISATTTILDGEVFFTNSDGSKMQGETGKGKNKATTNPATTGVSSAKFRLLTESKYANPGTASAAGVGASWSDDFVIANIRKLPPFYPFESQWKDPATVDIPAAGADDTIKYVSVSIDGYLKLASIPVPLKSGENLSNLFERVHELFFSEGASGYAAAMDNPIYAGFFMIYKFGNYEGVPYVLVDGAPIGSNAKTAGMSSADQVLNQHFDNVCVVIGTSQQYTMPVGGLVYDTETKKLSATSWIFDVGTYTYSTETLPDVNVVDPQTNKLIGVTGADGTLIVELSDSASGIVAVEGLAAIPLDVSKIDPKGFEPYRANDYADLKNYEGRFAPGLKDYSVFGSRPGKQLLAIVIISAVLTVPLACIVLYAQRTELRNRGRKFNAPIQSLGKR
jgi:hypothetical protein